MLKLYEFYVDVGRMGSLSGLFVGKDDWLTQMNGSTIYFGEVLGKHSDVTYDDFVWQDCCKVVSDDSDKIEWLIGILGYTVSGFNPLDYFDVETTPEFDEGYYADDPSECEYEIGSPEELRWKAGYIYKVEEELKQLNRKD